MKPWTAVLVLACCALLLPAGCQKKEAAPPPRKVTSVVDIGGLSPEDQMALKDLLRVDGVLMTGTQQVVAINNQVINIGDSLKVSVKGTTYTLQLLSIQDNVIRLKSVRKGGS